MEWHYVNGGVRIGPITPQAFETLLNDRIVRDDVLVWTPGWPEWRPWSSVAAETAPCLVSRGRFLIRDMVPYEDQYVSAQEKDAFFQKLREGVNTPGIMAYGGFWMRFLARFIDGLVLGVVNMVIVFGLSMVLFGSIGKQPGPNGNLGAFFAFQGLVLVSGMGLGLLYSWYFISRHAATPGKMALGLKIVRSDGTSLSNGRIIGRFFAEFVSGMIFYVGYIIAGFDDQKRALHDHICDTRVIRSK
ncbi:MAG TPA: RDD family protein [Candidatus Didemnitutus sp.]|nr:RDD family protein [Candidatus Didemnitutus sp.]